MNQNFEEASDNELLRAIRGGDQEALDVLLRRHYGAIYRFAFRMSSSAADASDITQEALVSISRAIRNFEGRSSFTSWAFRITANCSHDFFRKKSRQRDNDQEYAEQKSLEQTGEEGMPLSRTVLGALAKLPEKERAAIILTHYEGYTHAEVARSLGCAETTISWRIFQARKKLKSILKQELEQ